jgi:hypothetical protein
LLVGASATLYEKKVQLAVGLGVHGSSRPFCFFLYGAAVVGLWLAFLRAPARTHAQPLPVSAPVTTWAVRVADDSKCRESQSFVATLAAQIPFAQRTTESQAELVAEVAIFEGGLARVLVHDRILQSEAGFRELQLTSSSCEDNAEALALVIGVLVEAGRGAPPPPPPPPPPPLPLPPPPPPAAKPQGPKQVRHAWLGPRAGHDLNAAIGVGTGLLPGPAPLATVGWGIRGAQVWPFWLEATGSLRNTERVRFTAVYGSLLTCPLTGTWRTIRGRVCAGGSVGALKAEGRRLANTSEKTKALFLVGAELAASIPLVGPLELTLLGRLDVIPVRQRYLYDRSEIPDQTLYVVKSVSGSVFAGLALRFR